MNQQDQARDWMRAELTYEPETYDDCNEVNCTLLAETCASELDLYEDDGETIPEWVFDLAVEVSEMV